MRREIFAKVVKDSIWGYLPKDIRESGQIIIKKEERKEEFDKTVVCMHVRPYSYEFNNNVAHVFQHYVRQYPQLQFCLAAHEHHSDQVDLFEDGVMYYVSDCMKYRSYYVFTISADGYDWELVYY